MSLLFVELLFQMNKKKREKKKCRVESDELVRTREQSSFGWKTPLSSNNLNLDSRTVAKTKTILVSILVRGNLNLIKYRPSSGDDDGFGLLAELASVSNPAAKPIIGELQLAPVHGMRGGHLNF